MLKRGDSVVIRGSRDLDRLKLSKLNKMKGRVCKVVYSEGKPIAAYVTFNRDKSRRMTLVPIKSLECTAMVNQIRTKNILKNTVL